MMDERSNRNLVGVHPDLQRVVRAAHQAFTKDGLSFVVTEGLRTAMRQAELVKVGASQTMNSRHLTGHAVDLAVTLNGDIRWDWPMYEGLGAAVKEAARNEKVSVVWGGDWRTLRDGPHFELDRLVYEAHRA